MTTADLIKGLIEILLIGFLVYRLLLLFRETRALRLLKGLGVLIIVYMVVNWLDLTTLRSLFDKMNVVSTLVITLIVLFTPEFKEALARLGGRARFGEEEEGKVSERLREIVRAVERLSEQAASDRVGALLVLGRRDGLNDRERTGVPVQAALSADLLVSIFQKHSPLHDGAAIVRDGMVTHARCTLPLQVTPEAKQHGVGMRHQAALGIASDRDAVAVVVSEERGTISLALDGKMEFSVTPTQLSARLREIFEVGARRAAAPGAHRAAWKAAFTAYRPYKLAGLALATALWLSNSQTITSSFTFMPSEHSFRGYNEHFEQGSLYLANRDEIAVAQFRMRGSNAMLLYVTLQQRWFDPEFLANELVVDVSGVHETGAHRVPLEFRRALAALEILDPVEVVFDRVEALAGAAPGVAIVGRPPPGYHLDERPPLVQFEEELPPLFVPSQQRAAALAALEACATEPPLDVSARTESINQELVRVRLPAAVAAVSPRAWLAAKVTVLLASDVLPKSEAELAAERELSEAREEERLAEQKVLVEDAKRLADVETVREKEPWTLQDLANAERAREQEELDRQNAAKDLDLRREALVKHQAAPTNVKETPEWAQTLNALQVHVTAADLRATTRRKVQDSKAKVVEALRRKLAGALEAQRAKEALTAKFEALDAQVLEWEPAEAQELEKLRAEFAAARDAAARTPVVSLDDAGAAALGDLLVADAAFHDRYRSLSTRAEAYGSRLTKFLIARAEWRSAVVNVEKASFPAVAAARAELRERELDLEARTIAFEARRLGLTPPDRLGKERFAGEPAAPDPELGARAQWRLHERLYREGTLERQRRWLAAAQGVVQAAPGEQVRTFLAGPLPPAKRQTLREQAQARLKALDDLLAGTAETEAARSLRAKAHEDLDALERALAEAQQALAEATRSDDAARRRLESELQDLRLRWQYQQALVTTLDRATVGLAAQGLPGWREGYRQALTERRAVIALPANGEPSASVLGLLALLEARAKPPETPPAESPAPGANGTAPVEPSPGATPGSGGRPDGARAAVPASETPAEPAPDRPRRPASEHERPPAAPPVAPTSAGAGPSAPPR